MSLRVLERFDRGARVGELGALDFGELLQLAQARVVVARGVDEAFAKLRDATKIFFARPRSRRAQ